jgi:hypothetical protein
MYKNLKKNLPNLLEWSKEDGSYAELDELYGARLASSKKIHGHVTKKCCGIYTPKKTYDMITVINLKWFQSLQKML